MSLEAKAEIALKTNVTLYEFPPDFTYEDVKRLKKEGGLEKYVKDKVSNLVVDTGMTRTIDLWIGDKTGKFTHCGVGSGINAPAAGDTDLQTPIGRETVTEDYRTGLTAFFDTFFSTTAQNGNWNETGIFSAAVAGDMLCRAKFASTFVKNTTKTAMISWAITLSAVV